MSQVFLAPDKDLLKIITDNGVDIVLEPTTQFSPVQEAIGGFISPTVFILGAIFFIFRLQKYN